MARSVLKLDISKAFDSVRWSFITDALSAMGIPDMFVQWIHTCLSTATFSVAVNGELEGFFGSERGLRQGCALSPYLFVIAINVLSRMLNNAAQSGSIGFHPSCSEVNLTHLSFADDLMIFTDGTSRSVQCIADTMEEFALWSGLRMNRAKTELFTAGLNDAETLDISRLGFNMGSMPIRYLGLPLMYRKLRISDYRSLLEKISSNFNCWSAKALSFAGRRQLLSSVIYGSINF